ncbi:MAG TPA: purine-nucleoside phosphorylase, partial [Chthoniobacterales bacterium]
MSDAGLDRLRGWRAEIAIVLGSGLNVLVSSSDSSDSVACSEFPELPKPSVPGHEGRFVLGKIGSTRVIFAQGRVHLYEGHTAHQVTGGIRILAAAGIKRLILTNAAGVANENFSPGSWMMIRDHINLTGATPLLGSAQFVDLTETYS